MPDPTPPGFYDFNLPPIIPPSGDAADFLVVPKNLNYEIVPVQPPPLPRPVLNLIEIFRQASAAGRNGLHAVHDFIENRRMTRQSDN